MTDPMADAAPEPRDTPRADETPTDSAGGAGQPPTPVSAAKMVVLTLFSLGVVAIPLVLVVGLVVDADLTFIALAIGVGCLLLAAVWTYALDTARWIGATQRLARTRGLLPTKLPKPDEAPTAPAPVADDDSRLDRRRVTRLVAEAQRKDPKLKQRRPPA